MNTKYRSGARINLFWAGVFAVLVLFAVRLVNIQVVSAEEYREIAGSNYITEPTWGTRGSIVDANGTVLAASVDRFNITADPSRVDQQGFDRVVETNGQRSRVHIGHLEALAELAEIVGVSESELAGVLGEDPESRFVYLAKAVTLEVFREVQALRIPWVYSQPQPARSYPLGTIAGNLVGFMGADGPLAGTELQLERCLAASDGEISYAISQDGVRMPGSEVTEKPSRDGGTVHLSINADLQWFIQQAIAEQGGAIGAEWASAVVVEVKTGRIVAVADWPSIDPNVFEQASPESTGSRSFTAPYEPGSVIKTATVAGLLDAGVVEAGTQFLVPSRYTATLPPGVSITDSWGHGELRYTTAGILVNSSNIGIGQLSELLPLERRVEYLRSFGFGSPSGANFLGEESGFVRPADQSDSITSVTQQFGQGMTATSVQVASLYQTIGNGGVRLPLTLVDGCEEPDGTMTQTPNREGVRVVSPYAADTTLEILEGVTTQYHLARQLAVPGYRIAAKSGTAQVAANGGYGNERIVSISGVFPVDDPQFAIHVSYAKPVSIRTSVAAAPTFHAIVKQLIKTFRITPSNAADAGIPLNW